MDFQPTKLHRARAASILERFSEWRSHLHQNEIESIFEVPAPSGKELRIQLTDWDCEVQFCHGERWEYADFETLLEEVTAFARGEKVATFQKSWLLGGWKLALLPKGDPSVQNFNAIRSWDGASDAG